MKLRDQNKNVIETPLDTLHRYCQFCHLGLVMKEPEVFMCPRCGCNSTLKQTEPAVKIKTRFPVFDPSKSSNEVNIIQPDSHKLPRSQWFIKKNQEKRNEIEDSDPYLQILKSRQDLHITSTEYFSYSNDSDY